MATVVPEEIEVGQRSAGPRIMMLRRTKDIATELTELLGKAEREILISSGKLNAELYGSRGIVEAVQDALEAGLTVKVIVGPHVEESELKNLLEEQDALRVLRTVPPLHFAVVDRTHFRLEDAHKLEDCQDIPSNKVGWDLPKTSTLLARYFWTLSRIASDKGFDV